MNRLFLPAPQLVKKRTHFKYSQCKSHVCLVVLVILHEHAPKYINQTELRVAYYFHIENTSCVCDFPVHIACDMLFRFLRHNHIAVVSKQRNDYRNIAYIQ